MRFYGRKTELAELEEVYSQSVNEGKLVVLTGRRRVGKTLLALEFLKDKPGLYLFISRKTEVLLCSDLLTEIKKQFNLPFVGDHTSFSKIFELLLEISKNQQIIVILDEFQEFFRINDSVFSDIQRLWDLNKRSSQMTLVIIGSVYSLIHKIFQDSKEPLFGRADRFLKLEAFSISTLKEIARDFGIVDRYEIFNLYAITGAMPKYLDLLLTNQALSFDQITHFMVREHSLFLSEGRHLLMEEFGRDHLIYFSILELLASGKTSRPELESILEKDVGGYLKRLEVDYGLIASRRPFDAKPQSRQLCFYIRDNFLKFWFYFIYRHRQALEMKNYSYVIDAIKADYRTFCGPLLEKYFLAVLVEEGNFNRVGSYWEKRHLNEIDIVATNDREKRLFFAEVKLNPAKISIEKLREKSLGLARQYRDYSIEYRGFSLEDV